jgi:hypothetical protein
MAPSMKNYGETCAHMMFWATLAHCSSGGAALHKEQLCQYLYLGLPGVLTKHLCSGTSVAWGRMCKGDDWDDRFLMTIL